MPVSHARHGTGRGKLLLAEHLKLHEKSTTIVQYNLPGSSVMGNGSALKS